MRYLSFFVVAVIATASLAVSGCGGTETAPTTDGGGAAAAAEGSTSSTAPATGEGLTEVSFDVKGMT